MMMTSGSDLNRPQLPGQREMDVFEAEGPAFDLGCVAGFQISDAFFDDRFGRAGAGGNDDRFDILEPMVFDILGAVDELSGYARFLGDFFESLAVGTVLTAEDEDQIGLVG